MTTANEAMQADETAAMLVNMRAAHQRALLNLIEGERRSEAIAMLGQVAQALEQLCEGAPVAAQWQAFARLAQTLSGAEGRLDAGAAKLLRQVDAALRALALGWPDSLHAPAFPELAGRLLEAAEQGDRIRPPAHGPRAALKPLDPAPVQPDAEASDEPPADRFAAQVEEALRNIDQCLPAWRRQPQEPEPLQDLRQAFRNLKDSAKQASAGETAELAWAIENLLDRVAERTVAASDALFALVERAALLLSVLQTGIEPDQGRLAALVEDADFLASGGNVEAPQAELPTALERPAAEPSLLAEAEASSALRAQAEQCLTELADGLRGLAAALEQARPADDGEAPAGISKLPALLSQVEQAQRLLAEQAGKEAQLKDGLKRSRQNS